MKHRLLISTILFLNIQFLSAQDFPTSFPWLKDTVYVSGSANEGGNGSITSPYNSWDNFTFKSKTAYLFHRGDTMDVTRAVVVRADSIYFGGYGNGDRPFFYGKTTNKHFYFSGNQQYIQGINVQCLDTGTCITFAGDSSKFLWADSITLSHAWWGTNPGGYGKIILSNFNIHRIRVDGIYSSYNDTIIVKNTYIHDVNRWYDWKQDIGNSGGDCIQGELNGYVIIDNCRLDHSDMAGKFALIQNGADTVIVKNSTLIGYAKSSAVYIGGSKRGWSFDGCKIIGGTYGLWNHGKLLVKNCIFTGNTKSSVFGSNASIYNSTFANVPGGRVLDGWTVDGWKVYNCLFYNVNQVFGANYNYVWASHNNFYNNPDQYNTQPTTQWGDNSTTYDPLFNFSIGGEYDYYPSKDSKLIDAGIELSSLHISIPTDIYGYSRPNGEGFDIGAYEYYNDYEIQNIEYGEYDNPENPDKFILYPNPTNGVVYIDAANNEIQHVRVFDVSGKQVLSTNLLPSNTYINLSEFKDGIFFIQIQIDGQIKTYKVIKE
jgi:hypothetical protein